MNTQDTPVDRDAPSLNVDHAGEKKPEEYEDPILASLVELSTEQAWTIDAIQDHWRQHTYLVLAPADREMEEIDRGGHRIKRKTWKNRHAWALVNLQDDDYIKKPVEHRKEYTITEKGLQRLRRDGIIPDEE